LLGIPVYFIWKKRSGNIQRVDFTEE